MPRVPGDEAARGDREGEGGDRGGGGGGDEVGVIVGGGANGEVVGAQVQHLGPADDAERMSSSSPSSLFRYMHVAA